MNLGSQRPLITLKLTSKDPYSSGLGNSSIEKTVFHNGERCRVTLRRDLISVGCSDITPEAARHILDEWEKRFGKHSVESYEL